MKSSFVKAYKEIESKILSDKELSKNVELIALLGSVADKEESSNWSDLDVLVVLKSDRLGNILLKDLDRLREICVEVSRQYSFPISILSHTMNDFESYVSFEYLKHYSMGKCSYPNPSFLKHKIDRILIKRKVDDKVRQAYCAYHMRHIRFNLLRKYVSLNESNSVNWIKEFVKLLIDKMIKVTDLALNFKNLWPESKQEILDTARTELKVDVGPLLMALEIRKGWSNVADAELSDFIPKGLEYLFDVINLVLGEYVEPTPEERMFT